MLQKARITAFAISELLRNNQQRWLKHLLQGKGINVYNSDINVSISAAKFRVISHLYKTKMEMCKRKFIYRISPACAKLKSYFEHMGQ